MNKWKRHFSMLFLFPLLAIIILAAGGCTSESTPTPEPAPTEDVIEANDSSVLCQISRLVTWEGLYPREMVVLILESEDVGGLANYTKDKIDQTADVILDEDLDWLMVAMRITCRIQLRANPEGGSSYYISDIAREQH